MAFLKPRRFISVVGRRSSVPDGLWLKCDGCAQPVLRSEVEENLWACPRCDHHYRIPSHQRITYLVDPGSFHETHDGIASCDPLGFEIEAVGYRYLDKLEEYRQKTGLQEAIVTGLASVMGQRTSLAVMDFGFAGASMGSAVGEKFCRAAEDAIRDRLPYTVLASSGGARMQEGILSLMQMAKTANTVRALNDAGIPYVVVLTNPTTGGVYASFAGLGDVTIAEPGAHIGFAGPRLIESALKVKLPEGFQSAEYQFENGFVDQIVPRSELRPFLGRLLRYLAPS